MLLMAVSTAAQAQITLLHDHQNLVSPPIGTFQGINFREAGFSGLCAIPNTNGKEFWTVSDRGVNVDAANANPAACRPTYDKIYGFPTYAPKIHRIRLNSDNTVQILQTITLKRPNGTTASGLINPTGYGSTAAEIASTDTVLNCANFNLKTVEKDVWGIDSEGIIVDNDGFFWICEEGGPTIWKVNANGVVVKRYTPYANLPGAQPEDVQIDSVFKYRKNNRGFEGISIAPNGKIYAIIQSPILYPTKSVGEGTRIHRILEINPATNETKMFAYLNEGIIGASGSNQIRLRDWKIGDMTAINDHQFLLIEAALRGTSDFKRIYMIDINGATPVHSGLYNGVTLEALVDQTGLTANGIVPVQKTLLIDLLANGWPAVLDKAEGITIINDSTIAIGNDNDYGQVSPLENGVATATTNTSHVFTYRLQGSNKLTGFVPTGPTLAQGLTGPSTAVTPYIQPLVEGGQFTSILTANEVVNGYRMVGIPDGLGAFDNGDGTFTVLMNHEIPNPSGIVRAHGSNGAFVSKWIVNKSDLSVVSGSDLIQFTHIWDITTNAYVQTITNMGRFCSADLPPVSAFYNSTTGLGTQARIFMNGEETGNEGRAFAHIASGAEAGHTYQLPRLGRLSYENAVASPGSGDKTVVISTDDSTPGQVYVYVGTKTSTGLDIDKAGLTNGKLYGVAVTSMMAESSAVIPAPGTAFALAELGEVQNMTGGEMNTNSNILGITTFLRPEDGHWDPSNPNDFYFVTTNSFTNPSRMWRLRFADVKNPELGGTIEAVIDGTEGPKMMDNMTIDNHGHVLIVEDVGGQPHLGKVWQYTIATDSLKLLAQHDPARFITGAPNFLTQDEEASGIIDAEEILGRGMFLLDVQAHYSIPGEVYEGGQLLAYFNPDTYCEFTSTGIEGPSNACNYSGFTGSVATYSVSATDAAGYHWTLPARAILISGQGTNTIQVKFTNSFASGNISVKITSACGDSSVTKTLAIGKSVPAVPGAIEGPVSACSFIGTGEVVTYSIAPVEDATSYTWVLPAKTALISGQGTTSIQVKFNAGYVTSSIKVKSVSNCGNSALQLLRVSSIPPIRPGTITGEQYSICGSNNTIVYTIEPVLFATDYLWTTSVVGATIVSEGTKATITFPAFTTGTVSVASTNSCGTSPVKTISVYARPDKPSAIRGSEEACAGSVQVYEVDSIAGTTTYQWTLPKGSVIQSGAGTNRITALIGNSGGTIRVIGFNSCAGGLSSTLKLDIVPCESASARMQKQISVYPVPTDGHLNIAFTTKNVEPVKIYVTDLITGAVVFESAVTSASGENSFEANLNTLKNGFYFLHVISPSIAYEERIEIKR